MTTAPIADTRPVASLAALVRRSVQSCQRQPALVAGPLFMSAFFLFIYDGQMSYTFCHHF